MAERSKSRRRKAQGPNILAIVLGPIGITVLMVAVIGTLWYRNRPEQVAFEPDTTIGETALVSVQTFPDQGREHVELGEPVDYDSDFPTSGPHDPNPTMPGVYTDVQRPEQLVHSLEHGNIVIYYDQPAAETKKALVSWADQFSGPWDGIVVVPKAGLGQDIVLTAWTKKLVMPEFDPQAAATFIDEYRGRGPENPVR
ncbi:DUF3105 domain-containing protein [Leptolyngbya sp. KIOST-1]|uniref:DUF3105 domain-containing protein n=1 Tax=Leptolyngbya sp. KIOST-1 TaxID=1229172 RepID=UPI000565857D|nr:DUF3105 domain-containing protein [Leptolyngbya sp. KIOST-1]